MQGRIPSLYRAFFCAILFFSLTSVVNASLTVTDINKVSSARVSRTDFEYTYEVTVINDNGPVENVSAIVSTSATGTTITEALVEFADIGAFASSTSTGTFTLRQNRRYSFNPSFLNYQFTYNQLPLPPNTPPVAVAGPNQLIYPGHSVYLNGGNSFDNEQVVLSYSWTFVERPPGSNAQFDNSGSVSPVFTPDYYGRYVAELVVSDGIDASEPSQVSINIVGRNVDVNFDHEISRVDQDVVEYCYGRNIVSDPGCTNADLNRDYYINAADLEIISYAISKAAPSPDLNNDGYVNTLDLDILNPCFGEVPYFNSSCLIADVNGDNHVDTYDSDLISHYLNTGGYVFVPNVASSNVVTDSTGATFSLDNLIVILSPGSSRSDADLLASLVGGSVSGYLGGEIYMLAVNASTIPELDGIIGQLISESNVLNVMEDMAFSEVQVMSDFQNLSYVDYNHRRSFESVFTSRAWDLYEAVESDVKSRGGSLSTVKVGVIDSGVNKNHAEFKNNKSRIDIYPASNSSDFRASFLSGNHGSSITGIIAADINSGVMTGIAEGALKDKLSVLSVKAFDILWKPSISDWYETSKGSWDRSIFKSIHDAAKSGASVINMSFGGSNCKNRANYLVTVTCEDYLTPLAEDVVKHKRRAETYQRIYNAIFNFYPQTLFVVAAGNLNMDASTFIPGGAVSAPNVITVGATNAEGNSRSSFSNWGTSVDIFAPGEHILSPRGPVQSQGYPVQMSTNGYALPDGTSQAAPMVAATAAILQTISSTYRNPVNLKSHILGMASTVSDEAITNTTDLTLLDVCRSVEGAIVGLSSYGGSIPSNFCRLPNGNFEDSGILNSWVGVGDFSTIYNLSSIPTITPKSGSRMGLLRSNGNVRFEDTHFETEYGLPAGSIKASLDVLANSSTDPTFGSMMVNENVSARKSQMLEFSYNFINGILYGSDFAFYAICLAEDQDYMLRQPTDVRRCKQVNGSIVGEVRSFQLASGAHSSTGNSNFRQTGWKTVQYQIPESGEYIFMVGVMDEGTPYGAHLLMVDDIDILEP